MVSLMKTSAKINLTVEAPRTERSKKDYFVFVRRAHCMLSVNNIDPVSETQPDKPSFSNNLRPPKMEAEAEGDTHLRQSCEVHCNAPASLVEVELDTDDC